MTINTENSRSNDLVNRYAARVRSRHSDVMMPARSAGRSHGIHTFGRRPAKRTRNGSTRSRQAITTLMATAIMATSAPAVSAGSSSSYQVQSGDTLTQIAANHGLTVDELVQINGVEDPDRILVGAELLLSGQADQNGSGDELDEVQVGDTVYEIREGDSLTGIAIEHDVMLSELLAVNDIENVDRLQVGDFLIIPTGSDAETEVPEGTDPIVDDLSDASDASDASDDRSHIVSLHLVGRGETPGGIAQRYGITVSQLMQANDLAETDMVMSGSMLNIPDASWTPNAAEPQAAATPDEAEAGASASAQLEGMPALQQSLSLSCESAALSIATAYWGHQVSEWVFIENMPYDVNPHRGFRGNMSGPFGGTDDYGVYAKPLSAMLANYGFVGEEFYTMGDPQPLKERIDQGQPVLVWMTSGASQQTRSYEWHQGERFSLTPQQHVVVAYGYDENNIYVSDPGTGQHATYSWDAFTQSWGQFDGMSMAVYPKG